MAQVPGVLLAAKADLTERRVVAPKAGADLAAGLNLQYFESSAKDHTGVEVRLQRHQAHNI